MPKAILVFDLGEEYEEDYFKYASTGLDVRLAVCDFDEWLRSEIKHGPVQKNIYTGEAVEVRLAILQEVRDKLYATFEDHAVDWEVV